MGFLDKVKEKEYKHKWYLENKSRLIKKSEDYVAKNMMKIKDYKSTWYSQNKIRIKNKMQDYYVKKQEAIKVRTKRYYLNNRAKMLLCSSNYRASHKTQRNRHTKKRLKSDMKFKLNCLISTAIGDSLRCKGLSKKGRSWEKLLNFSRKTLQCHLFRNKDLENNFLQSKMDIDHKTPLSWFSFSSEKDLAFRNAWSLENLQLLPRNENRVKHNCYCADVMLALSLIGRG